MKILKYKEKNTDETYSMAIYYDFGIQVDHFTEIVKQYETKYNAKLFDCYCRSYDGNGSPLFTICYDEKDLKEIKDWPNPYVTFYATFNDKLTGEYKFNLSTSTNSELITYIVDKKKLQESEMKETEHLSRQ